MAVLQVFREFYLAGYRELRSGSRFALILAIWWLLVAVGDAVSTYILLQQHMGYEANPVAAFLFESITKELMFLISLPLCFVILCMTIGASRLSTVVYLTGLLVLLIKTLAVASNFSQLISLNP